MPTSSTFGDLINDAALQNGVPVDWMTSILNVENPNLNPNAKSYTNVRGLSQITEDTWNTVNPGTPYSLDPAAQLNTQAKLLAKYQADYGGDFALAAAAYNGGPKVADIARTLIAQGAPEADAISQAAAQVYGDASTKQKEINNYVVKATGQSAASLSTVNKANQVAYLTDDSDPAVAVPVSGMTIPASQLTGILTAINPPLVNTDGLNRVPWYADKNVLQVSSPNQDVGFPVTFQIYYNIAQDPLPIVIALKASVRSHQKAMRHLSTRSRTKTGQRVNLWGMVPDQITGQASTGLMANQLGITDFLSLSTVPQDVQDLVLQAFQSSDMVRSDVVQSQLSNGGFMRVAAKDAFVELLALFRNNGTVWFQNQNYTGYTTGAEQMAADVWSPATGSTTFQNAARRNDVMTRGKVVMNFRNAAYYGYFKSLNWVMDATNPFRWNFNFVFQVESTIASVSVPNS